MQKYIHMPIKSSNHKLNPYLPRSYQNTSQGSLQNRTHTNSAPNSSRTLLHCHVRINKSANSSKRPTTDLKALSNNSLTPTRMSNATATGRSNKHHVLYDFAFPPPTIFGHNIGREMIGLERGLQRYLFCPKLDGKTPVIRK
ncbi:protein STRUBBELIG-receptor FAMILY 7-like [Dorcoceras hygrometricum]|uniref:Protein STRUBBELIG-receptor FAMILY 7-like n=1 Tax=Dorcoceras hygrometricum TaxID=472368 RepID=A0A2Z7B7K1_9LAMI|nr:protein STRUBBELIG-receptor FAMILY 7-like [Dorcoceras hygrometricum]